MSEVTNSIISKKNVIVDSYNDGNSVSLRDAVKSLFDVVFQIAIILGVNNLNSIDVNNDEENKEKIEKFMNELSTNKALKEKDETLTSIIKELYKTLSMLYNIFSLNDVKSYLFEYRLKINLISFLAELSDKLHFGKETYERICDQTELSMGEKYNNVFKPLTDCEQSSSLVKENEDSDDEEVSKIDMLESAMSQLISQLSQLRSNKISKMQTNEYKLNRIMSSANPDFGTFFALLPNTKINPTEIIEFIKIHFYEADNTKPSQAIKRFVNPLRKDIMYTLDRVAGDDINMKKTLDGINEYWNNVCNKAITNEIDNCPLSIVSSKSLN